MRSTVVKYGKARIRPGETTADVEQANGKRGFAENIPRQSHGVGVGFGLGNTGTNIESKCRFGAGVAHGAE